MQWNGSFWPKISPIIAFRLQRSIQYSRTKHTIRFYLRNRTTAQTEYLMGSTVNNSLILWVCKLSFLKRHPSIQKSKILKYHALIAIKEKKTPSVGYTPPLCLIKYRKKTVPYPNILKESNCRPQLGSFELNQLKIKWNFKYITSVLQRDE
jgi:hypothetical protein